MKINPVTNKPLLSKDERLKRKAENIELIKKVIKTVCPVLNIKEAELLSSSRKRELVNSRGILNLHLMRKDFTSIELGEVLGRDHTTILYSANEMGSLISIYPDLKEKYELVVKCIHFSGILDKRDGSKK